MAWDSTEQSWLSGLGWHDADRRPALRPFFPEGLHEMWDDTGFGRADGIDDPGFLKRSHLR
jgi:hypothetical protein